MVGEVRGATESQVSTVSLTDRRQGADVLPGDHDVVPPDLAHTRLGLGHVAVEPDGVDVEFGCTSPGEAGKGLAAFNSNTLTLLIVPGNALSGHVGFELVIRPGAD